MNAYELADELENYVWMNPNNNRDYCKEVKDMLRQQADRIAELSKNVDELEEELLKATHPNSEPVAWINREEGSGSILDWEKDPYSQTNIPLYTTPQKYCPSENNASYEKGVIDGMAKQRQSRVDGIIGQIGDSPIHDLVHRTTPQIKELSDEEIQEISHDFGEIAWLGETTYKFARAILKKASEK